MTEYVYVLKELDEIKLSMTKHSAGDPELDNLVKFKYVGSENVYYASKEFVASRAADVEYVT